MGRQVFQKSRRPIFLSRIPLSALSLALLIPATGRRTVLRRERVNRQVSAEYLLEPGETQLCAKQPLGDAGLGANNPAGDGNLWCRQRLHQTKFGTSQSTHEAKLGSAKHGDSSSESDSPGESCKRTEKLRLESSKGLDDVVLLLPDCLKADGGGGGGGVHGDCHHYQQHQVFQRHRDWLLQDNGIEFCVKIAQISVKSA